MPAHLLLAPGVPVHRVRAVRAPVSAAWQFAQHSHYTAGGRVFWAAVLVAGVVLVICLATRRRRPAPGSIS